MRCINFDWLEVYCLEPKSEPRDAEFFGSLGFTVKKREYGTPQYREMFTILEGEFPMVEVRRNPYSLKNEGGVFVPESTHIRLSNRACYLQDPISYLRKFLQDAGYEFQSFSRVDICMDFDKLDDGTDPNVFLQDYARERYFKHHLSTISPHGIEVTGANICGHGTDKQFGRQYNSWSWGSPNSAISVKMYDKTLELAEVKDKYYIRDQWEAAGLITQEDNRIQADIRDTRYWINLTRGKLRKASGEKRKELRGKLNVLQQHLSDLIAQVRHIWRLEFSIKSSIKGFVKGDENDTKKNGSVTMYPLDLHTLGNRNTLQLLYMSLAKKYFWFKVPSRTRNGTPQRKDRCQDYWPILYNGSDVYTPCRASNSKEPTRMDRIISNKLRSILDEAQERGGYEPKFLAGVTQLLQYFSYKYRLHELERAHNDMILACCKSIQFDFENIRNQGNELIEKLEMLKNACMDMQDEAEEYAEKCEDF